MTRSVLHISQETHGELIPKKRCKEKTQRQLPAPAPPWADLCSAPALAAWAIWRRPTGRAILQALPGTGPAGGWCLNRPSMC